MNITTSNQVRSFCFDRVFAPHESQEEVFSDTSVRYLSIKLFTLLLMIHIAFGAIGFRWVQRLHLCLWANGKR